MTVSGNRASCAALLTCSLALPSPPSRRTADAISVAINSARIFSLSRREISVSRRGFSLIGNPFRGFLLFGSKSITEGALKVESLADAARRLLSRLDARRAREIERSGSTVVQSAGIRTAPDAGDDASHKIATDEPTPRVSDVSLAGESAPPGGGNVPRASLPVFAARRGMAVNDNRRGHADALDMARCWLHSAQSADVAKLIRQ